MPEAEVSSDKARQYQVWANHNGSYVAMISINSQSGALYKVNGEPFAIVPMEGADNYRVLCSENHARQLVIDGINLAENETISVKRGLEAHNTFGPSTQPNG